MFWYVKGICYKNQAFIGQNLNICDSKNIVRVRNCLDTTILVNDGDNRGVSHEVNDLVGQSCDWSWGQSWGQCPHV